VIRGLALAGVTGAGKSSVFDALTRRFAADPGCSVCILRNALLQNGALPAPGAAPEEVRARALGYLGERVAALAGLASLAAPPAPDAKAPRLVVLCESLMLNLLAELGLEMDGGFAELDRARAAAGIAMVHLRLDAHEVRARSVESTRRHRGPGWGRYLDALGSTPPEQEAVFERRRQAVARSFARCLPPKIEIHTSEMAWEDYASQLAAHVLTPPASPPERA
jgi:hypothetical protein